MATDVKTGEAPTVNGKKLAVQAAAMALSGPSENARAGQERVELERPELQAPRADLRS
jgi:hypothetical protein